MDAVIRGISIYVVLLAVTRFSGRRTLAQTTPFDFVLLLIVAETTQQALLGDDFSITNAVIIIVTLFSFDIVLSYVKQWSKGAALLLDGSPTVLISKGKLNTEAIEGARVNIDDILESAREKHGLKSLDEIDAAVLEISGSISIVPKAK